jgi:hypothetical protein
MLARAAELPACAPIGAARHSAPHAWPTLTGGAPWLTGTKRQKSNVPAARAACRQLPRCLCTTAPPAFLSGRAHAPGLWFTLPYVWPQYSAAAYHADARAQRLGAWYASGAHADVRAAQIPPGSLRRLLGVGYGVAAMWRCCCDSSSLCAHRHSCSCVAQMSWP